MLPQANELEILKQQIIKRIASWNIPSGWEKFIQVRVEVAGIASNRQAVLKLTQDAFSDFSFYQEDQPNLNHLYHHKDPDREQIAIKFQEWLENLEWTENSQSPGKADILEEALKLIYGIE
jgi:hypothetical protein